MQNQVQQQKQQQQQQQQQPQQQHNQQQQAVQVAQQAIVVAQQQLQHVQPQEMICNVNQVQNQQISNVSNTDGFLRPPQAPCNSQMMQSKQHQPNKCSLLLTQLTAPIPPTFQQTLDMTSQQQVQQLDTRRRRRVQRQQVQLQQVQQQQQQVQHQELQHRQVEQQQVQQQQVALRMMNQQQQQEQNVPKIHTIWTGTIEWMHKSKNGTALKKKKTKKYVPCSISAYMKNGEPELKAETWPEKLVMQLMSTTLSGYFRRTYATCSNSVVFQSTQCEALDTLTKYITAGNTGCVHLNCVPKSRYWDDKFLILMCAPNRKSIIGFIPKDQATFVERIHKFIHYKKASPTILHQGQDNSNVAGKVADQKTSDITTNITTDICESKNLKTQNLEERNPQNSKLRKVSRCDNRSLCDKLTEYHEDYDINELLLNVEQWDIEPETSFRTIKNFECLICSFKSNKFMDWKLHIMSISHMTDCHKIKDLFSYVCVRKECKVVLYGSNQSLTEHRTKHSGFPIGIGSMPKLMAEVMKRITTTQKKLYFCSHCKKFKEKPIHSEIIQLKIKIKDPIKYYCKYCKVDFYSSPEMIDYHSLSVEHMTLKCFDKLCLEPKINSNKKIKLSEQPNKNEGKNLLLTVQNSDNIEVANEHIPSIHVNESLVKVDNSFTLSGQKSQSQDVSLDVCSKELDIVEYNSSSESYDSTVLNSSQRKRPQSSTIMTSTSPKKSFNINDLGNNNFNWSVYKCIFCNTQLNGDSKILKCLHIICNNCALKKKTGSTLECIICKTVTNGQLTDYPIISPSSNTDQTCSEQSCFAKPKIICVHCQKLYCTPCSKDHLQDNENHNPNLMIVYPTKLPCALCPSCTKKCIEVYCTQCLILICALCHLNSHEDHSFKVLEKLDSEIRTDLNEKLRKLKQIESHIRVGLDQNEKQIENLRINKNLIEEKIDIEMNKLHENINERHLKLRNVVEKYFTDYMTPINEYEQNLRTFNNNSKYCEDLAEAILKHDNKCEVVSLSKAVINKIKCMQKHYSDIKSKEVSWCEPNLQFNYDETFQKCVSSIRAITGKDLGVISSSTGLNSSEVNSEKTLNSDSHTSENIETANSNKTNIDTVSTTASEVEVLVQCICCEQWNKELINCDYCDRHYHNDCHIPALPKNPPLNELQRKWKCTMCQDITKYSNEMLNKHDWNTIDKFPINKKTESKIVERILLELYCQKVSDIRFRKSLIEGIYPRYYENYYCSSLNDVKTRFESKLYLSLFDVLKDVKQIFVNALLYYPTGDPNYLAAFELESTLNTMITKWIPTFDQTKLPST